jgi:hypothetical protein
VARQKQAANAVQKIINIAKAPIDLIPGLDRFALQALLVAMGQYVLGA